jgi:hypothetical protein
MMKNFFIIIVLLSVCAVTNAQNDDALFNSRMPLDMAFSMSIKKVAGTKGDSEYIAHKLYYTNASSIQDSIDAGLKARGNFRLQNCFFPPLWMKIDKKDAKGTLFEGNKKLKLVLPCDNSNGSNELIVREYLCYRLYEEISIYSFKTRLVNIALTELRGKKKKDFNVKGILIEDVDKTAKRVDAKTVDAASVPPTALHDTDALRFDFFQFLIANTDWSKSYQHNSKIIYKKPNFIALPYDFDMSGVVDAHYAVVSMIGDQQLPIEHVTERYYRGYCKPDALTQFVRKEYLAKEEKLLSVPNELKGELPDKEITEIKNYLKQFFDILRSDRLFDDEITGRCRQIN